MGYYTVITDGLQLFYHHLESPYEQCPLEGHEGQEDEDSPAPGS